jgi:ABC-type Mn2+/Zn2+ transport system ATPase subunit
MFVASLNNVTAQYGSQKVLKGVSFEIQSGERLGLIGPNGSGKTTMLRILLGDDVPSEGSVNIAGNVRIGYVPQYVDANDDELVIEWLIAECVELGEKLREAEATLAAASDDELDSAMETYQVARDNYDNADADRRPDEAQATLDSLGLQGRERQQIGTLSGGEKNVLSLARALLNDPDFLILNVLVNRLFDLGHHSEPILLRPALCPEHVANIGLVVFVTLRQVRKIAVFDLDLRFLAVRLGSLHRAIGKLEPNATDTAVNHCPQVAVIVFGNLNEVVT